MPSFADMLDFLERRNSPLMDSGDYSQSISTVRAGHTMHKPKERSFWEEFIELCGNTQGMSELLGVSPEKVASWPSKIKQALEKMNKENSEQPSPEERSKLLPTGNNGALTVNTDPQMGEL